MRKLEDKLNKLWNAIKELPMEECDIKYLNMQAFLYSVGRLNILQVLADLTKYALAYSMDIKEIKEILE